MADSFLNKTGLTHLWSKIKTLLNNKADKDHSHNYAGSLTPGGAALTSAKLQTPRNISLTGEVSGDCSFDGSDNVEITTKTLSVIGTQTSSTNAFTGNLPKGITQLTDGMVIRYWLPYNGTTSTATLTLNYDSGGSTGALPVYFRATSRLTSHVPGGNYITLMYRENTQLNGSTYTGWWLHFAYDTNDIDRIRDNATSFKVGTNPVLKSTLVSIVESEFDDIRYESLVIDTTTKEVNTNAFVIGAPIYWSVSTHSANTIHSYMYSIYEAISSIGIWGMKAVSFSLYLPLYVECTVDEDRRHYHLTETLFTQYNFVQGNCYIFIGMMCSTTQCGLSVNNPMYYYDGTNLIPYDESIFSYKDHSHITSDITDFPTSLPNPTSLYIRDSYTNPTYYVDYNGSGNSDDGLVRTLVFGDNLEWSAEGGMSSRYYKISAKGKKLLYSDDTGWSSGVLSLNNKTDFDKYKIFIVKYSGISTDIVVVKEGYQLRGIGGYQTTGTQAYLYTFYATWANPTANIIIINKVMFGKISLTNGSSPDITSQTHAVTSIWGVE